MVDSLNNFSSEVTRCVRSFPFVSQPFTDSGLTRSFDRVAKEVGTFGELGGQVRLFLSNCVPRRALTLDCLFVLSRLSSRTSREFGKTSRTTST